MKCNGLWEWIAGAHLRAWFWSKLPCPGQIAVNQEWLSEERYNREMRQKTMLWTGRACRFANRIARKCRCSAEWGLSGGCFSADELQWVLQLLQSQGRKSSRRFSRSHIQDHKLRLAGRKGAGAWTLIPSVSLGGAGKSPPVALAEAVPIKYAK